MRGDDSQQSYLLNYDYDTFGNREPNAADLGYAVSFADDVGDASRFGYAAANVADEARISASNPLIIL